MTDKKALISVEIKSSCYLFIYFHFVLIFITYGNVAYADGRDSDQATHKDLKNIYSQNVSKETTFNDPGDELFFKKVNQKLDPYGIDLALSWIAETAGVVRGGRKNGVDYSHQIAFSIDMDWEKLAGIKGFSTHAMILNLSGRNASTDYVGDSQMQAQEIYGGGYARLVHMNYIYAEQKLWKDRIDIRAGRLSVGNEFGSSPFACQFMLISTCGQPRSVQSQQGFSPWPGTVWGARILVNLTSKSYFQVGAYESSPWYTGKGGVAGFDWSTNAATGAFVPVEVGYNPDFGKRHLTGYYRIGAGIDSSRFQTWSAQAKGNHKKDNRFQLWVMADQMIYRNDSKKDHGLYLIANYGHDSSTTSTFKDLYNIGFVDKGFWRKRPYDQIGFMLTYYTVPNSLKHAQQYQIANGAQLNGNGVFSLLNGAPGVQSNSTLIELNYGIAAYRGIMITPVFEYFHRVAATKMYKDAVVFGLKTNVNF